MSVHEEFQPGFSGLLGSGPGKHKASKLERLDHTLINKIENAIQQLWSIVRGEGHYGPFRLETTDGYVTETFNGDGSTTTFQLSKAIPREAISGYNIFLDNPYASGIQPASCSGYLTDFDEYTNLSDTVVFATAPPVGENNVKIIYVNITEWPSSVNSSAYLSEYTISS
ncbi:MAG: hypothetical protein DRI86_16190 [Bacteroidetes bacterium]|nr:MAG: hypothetical protein DRI86_16190 [Bacteroidota bacterium]